MTLTTKHLTDRTATALSFLVDHGFQYIRSFAHFRRSEPSGYSYIGIDSVTHNRAAYHLAFRLGVRIDALETIIRQVLERPTKLTHYDRSILNYTVNIGPKSLNWNHPTPGTWTFHNNRDIDDQLAEITTFVRDLALPFLQANATAAAIRHSLLESPWRAINPSPFQQILGVAVLANDAAQLDLDYAALGALHPQWHPPLKAACHDFYLRAKAFLQSRNTRPDAVPPVIL